MVDWPAELGVIAVPDVDDQVRLPGAGDLREVRRRKLEATQRLLGDTIAIDEAAWQQPSLLPGWTRAHVASHLARNADALSRILDGRYRGVTSPMYVSQSEQMYDIERGSERSGLDLQIDLDTSAGRLHRGLDALESSGGAELVELTPTRLLRADLLPLARLREVVLHHIDLDTGFTIQDIDDDIARWVLEWTCYWIGDAPGIPAMQIESTSGFHIRLGPPGRPVPVGGTDSLLLGWLTGRMPPGDTAARRLPRLPEGWRA
ncbi:maleylpyruvate isomerase [Propionibacterium cyclohexanicum]|uniref:Maleylpyruvate isomerase n=1 Tax=Propionibacterium cyclohexanicum TaxID=64702 RepID=A0A1H9PLR2_9ACTN|nr:maleylpyruvate isomerase family mycothiol-dependent enzyme [Propionibacterium cyclohexanicum]SER48729.1 maleylpyruvate isomerase [Propionibacterium cyclohexanicum]